MKMSDLRAKARAIFGNAIAEPMPKQPNGAKALQERANARPIPTYKVGGVVKKNDGGLLNKPIRGRSVTIPLEEEKRKTGKAPANAPNLPKMMRGPTKPGREEAMMEARRAAGMSREADDVMMTTRRGKEIMSAQKRMEDEKEMQRRKKQEAADKLLGMRMKNGGKAGCYKDGGDVKADRIAARMAAGNYKKGGKVQTSADTAKKLATEMGGMKKGGKPKDGLAVMIAIGKPMKKPEKKAVGGAGKTRKGMAPIKKAQGGAAKVRKGMMSPTGDIKKVVTPKKGIGGM